jgi:sec-independent protein translocase protein TatA
LASPSARAYISDKSAPSGERAGAFRAKGVAIMGGLSIWHWLILLAVVALLFGGRGKLSGIMGDAAKGIKEFKNGLKDEENPPAPVQAQNLPPETVERERDKA